MKTIEEEAMKNCEYNQDSLRRYDKYFIEAFKDGVEFAQRYITIEEELPQKGTFVIVKKKNGLELGMYYNADGEFMYGEIDQTREAVGWRPINHK